MNILTKLSLPFSRKRQVDCDTVILHATAGSSFMGAYNALKSRELSYHYIIEKDGAINKLVPYSRVAYHAGKSVGPNGSNVNHYSVGISFVNRNDGTDKYTKEQYEACLDLIESLKTGLPLQWITTHAFISPGRKTDPKNFPVGKMSLDCGLRLWTPL